MTKYLSDRAEVGQTEEVWAHQKVVAYLNQIFLAAHPVSKIGLRTARELQTLATTLDLLLAGWLRVLPMGWTSAVGIMQAAHRQIALRAPQFGGAGLEQVVRRGLVDDLSG